MIRRVYCAAFAVALLAACSVAPQTGPQGAYELTVAFAAALKAGNAYAAWPRCSTTQKSPCSRQAIVSKIAAAANKADAAVKGAQAGTTEIGTANDAVKALTQTIPAE